MEKGTDVTSMEDAMAFPREFDYEVPEYSSKQDPVYLDFVGRLAHKRAKNELSKEQKIAVTEYSLDHWEA